MQNATFFVDFDGTAATTDVGHEFFVTYSDRKASEAAVKEWMAGRISSIDLYHIECKTTRISRAELSTFLEKMQLDPHFTRFVEKCWQNDHKVIIISDGFETYIREILAKYDLNHLPVLANDMDFLDSGAIRPVFPYAEHSCGACANCKGHHLRKWRSQNPHAHSVYIGDGYSDRCGAREADVVFAKRDLQAWCEAKEVAFTAFDSFDHVITACVKKDLLTL